MPFLGFKHSDETKQKMSESHKGKSSGMLGKKHSDETKESWKLFRNKGRKWTPEIKNKISKSHMGIGHSEDTKKKLSKSMKEKYQIKENHPCFGKPCKDEVKKKISDKLKGVPQTEERKKKTREAILKNPFANHHIYLRTTEQEPVLRLTKSQHTRIHYKMYEYVLEKFGCSEVDLYIKWFISKYVGYK